jgi:hypothetical protein
VAAGVLFALAMYTYPPARVHVPLLMIALFYRSYRSHTSYRSYVVLLVLCIPLAWLTLDGTLTSRANALGVWSTEAPHTFFARGLMRHLSLDFLVLRGDLNPRHGTQMFGILSWLDLLALTGLLAGPNRKLLALGAFGFLTALAVASLTWEGVPHALRSITGWPFVALLTGALLAAACTRWRVMPYLVLICAIAFSAMFLNVYFTTYRTSSAPHFDAVLREEAERARKTGNWAPLRGYGEFYPREALRYYFLHYANESCAETTPK